MLFASPIHILVAWIQSTCSSCPKSSATARAAERLGVVQPTLTRVVEILEDQVGAPILNRGRYGVTATEIGARLAKSGTDIAHQMERAAQTVDQWKAGIGDELRVGVGPMLAISIMPRLIETYLEGRWPYLLKMTTATAGGLVNRLNTDELDVVLAPAQMNMHQERLVQEIVVEDRMAIYAGHKSRLVGAGSVALSELMHETWIAVGSPVKHPRGNLRVFPLPRF